VAALSLAIAPFVLSAASTSVFRFSGTQATNSIQGFDGTNAYGITLFNGGAANVIIQSNGASSFAGGITATPISGSTGAFTTLSASGLLTVASNVLIGSASPASDITTVQLFQGSNVARNWRLAANVAGGEFTITPSTAGGGTTYTTPILTVATTGLAVTGALSATTTLQAKQSTTNPASTGALPGLSMGFDAGGEVSWIQSERNSLAETRALLLNPNGGNVGIGTTSPGSKLDVNGELRIGNTVNTVSPTSPNRTVTIVIGGTTYYLAAKTTND
jgi:hypothetical protein